MKRTKSFLTAAVMAAAVIFGIAGVADAQRRNDRDLRDAVRALNTKLDDFETNLRYHMQSNSEAQVQITGVTDDIRALRDAVQDYEENLNRRRENRDDVGKIITAARRVNETMRTYGSNRRIEEDWRGVRTQIDRLSANYGVTTSWDEEEPQWVKDYPDPVSPAKTMSVGLSGTYELDRTRSESVDDIVADTTLGSTQREDLKEKLTAPEQIAIDIRGNQVTLATSNASPVTVTADGRDKVERSPTGKTIRLRATLVGDKLTVSSLGGETDYTIIFTSVSNGRGMKVSRRITTDYLRQTVFAESVYNKTDSVARLGIGTGGSTTGGYSDNDSPAGAPIIGQARPGNYAVPGGTIITGVLDNEINTKVSQNNDRFRLTVQSPNEFRGATIDGYISGVNRSGKVTGRPNVTFNFEKITLRDGQTYDFAGFLQGITDPTGKTVKVDNEGTAKGDSQTKETAKRGGIGAGIGAIIGAIAGGGKGAAIGAVIGGGAGAGSVIVTGKDDIRLMPGSTMTIQASSPNQQYPR
jgi:hypothetical protein